jgi:hypothetical protein
MVHGVTVGAAAKNRRKTVNAASRSRRNRKCETDAEARHRRILLSAPHCHVSCGSISAPELSACSSNAEMA